jgi:hypothetical protein
MIFFKDDQDSIPGMGRDLFHRILTVSGVQPASCPMGKKDSFSDGKSDRGVKMTTHLHPVPKLRMH